MFFLRKLWFKKFGQDTTDGTPTPQHVVVRGYEEGASFLILSPERMKKQRKEHGYLMLRGPAEVEAAVTKTQSLDLLVQHPWLPY